MFKLKGYQQRAVTALDDFLSRCKQGETVEQAYSTILKEQNLPELAYRDYNFKQVPYVCIRIPTGGGKTVLGSYAIAVSASRYLDIDYPIVLWLVPAQ